MEETAIKPPKSLLEKIAPFVLIVFLIVLAYFGFTKIKLGGGSGAAGTASTSSVQTASQAQVDIEFLNSDAFKNLKFHSRFSCLQSGYGNHPGRKGRSFCSRILIFKA